MRRSSQRSGRAYGFQSAPAIAGGRCAGGSHQRPLRDRFNPRPLLLAGDAPAQRQRHLRSWFQSAPAIAGGRCHRWWRLRWRRESFNPRPPLLAGDAGIRRGWWCWRCRFNPRPPLLAGDAADPRQTHASRPVSIRARHCWRAMHAVQGRQVLHQAFQSAPAIAGGRCVGSGRRRGE